MQIGVLGSDTSWYAADLERAAGSRHRVACLPFSRVRCELEGGDSLGFFSGGAPLARFDCLLVRSMPPGSLEQVVFRMDVLGRWEAAGRLVVNSPAPSRQRWTSTCVWPSCVPPGS